MLMRTFDFDATSWGRRYIMVMTGEILVMMYEPAYWMSLVMMWLVSVAVYITMMWLC